MAAPIFNRIETAEVSSYYSWNERRIINDGSNLVSDLSGDGIPDFVEVRETKSGKTHDCEFGSDHGVFPFDDPKFTATIHERTTWSLVLTEGKYNELGGLVRSARAYTLDSYVYTNKDYDDCEYVNPIGTFIPVAPFLFLDVKDYDGDCSAEISYWKYIGKDSDYRQVIQKRK